MEHAPTTDEIPLPRLYPHDEYSQRRYLHRLIETLPSAMLLRTIVLLEVGPTYLAGLMMTIDPSAP